MSKRETGTNREKTQQKLNYEELIYPARVNDVERAGVKRIITMKKKSKLVDRPALNRVFQSLSLIYQVVYRKINKNNLSIKKKEIMPRFDSVKW